MTGDDVKVVVIEPFFYKTEIINAEAMKRTLDKAFNESLEEIKKTYEALPLEQLFAKGQANIDKIARPNVSEVTEAMEKGVTLEKPKLFYRCGGYKDILLWAISHMPEVIVDFIIAARKRY